MNEFYKASIVREVVNKFFGVDICKKSRVQTIVEARQFYYKWLRENTDLSLKAIADTLPLNQDHSSVINAIDKFDDKMDMYGEIDVKWDELNIQIENRFNQSFAFNPS